MSLQTIEINLKIITFDKEKTREYRTEFNSPCDCQYCKNYYKNIEGNAELVAFLNDFGIDYNFAEEVFCWELEKDNVSLSHYEGYYSVFGKIDEEFDFHKYGVKISFQKGTYVNCDKTGDYFWICVVSDFPFILQEKRELSIMPSQKSRQSNIISKIKTLLKKQS